ncbi:MAG TPA: helix-turn-helix transcriptional regulator [Pseudonocardiaceae bacterium]
MSDDVGPAVRRRRLGGRLRELRVAAGFTTMEAAAAGTGLSRASISRIEGAKQVILPRTVRLLCSSYGIGSPLVERLVELAETAEQRGWYQDFADVVPGWFERCLGEESEATELWTYAAGFVPDLLQTDDYCRAMAAAVTPDVDVERLVELNAVRRRRVRAAQHVVLDESVLRREVGGPEVWRAQLRHLLADRSDVTIQVLPFAAGAHPALLGSFTMLRFPLSTGLTTVFANGMYPDDHQRHAAVFERLCALALSPDESAAMVDRADVSDPR